MDSILPGEMPSPQGHCGQIPLLSAPPPSACDARERQWDLHTAPSAGTALRLRDPEGIPTRLACFLLGETGLVEPQLRRSLGRAALVHAAFGVHDSALEEVGGRLAGQFAGSALPVTPPPYSQGSPIWE